MRRLVQVAEGHQQNNFDAIRLAMALLVVWSHSFAIHLGSEKTEWISALLNGAYNAGNLGVMAFFVISGFLITQSWERSRTARSYFEKRVRRIYPGYMVATTICAFIAAPLFGGTIPNAAKTVGLNLLLRNELPSAFPANPIPGAVNGSLWSIPFEFWCYIGVAAAGALLLKRPRMLIWLCILLMVGKVVQDVAGKTPSFEPIGTIFGWPYIWTRIGPSFLLGMIAYSYRDRLPRGCALLAGLAVSAIVACHVNRHLADMIVAPALAYGVFYVGFSERVRLHGAARCGDFSYGSYLYAFPIQQVLQATAGKHLSLPSFILLSAALSLAAGVLSWHLVEKHFMVRKPRAGPQPTTPRGLLDPA